MQAVERAWGPLQAGGERCMLPEDAPVTRAWLPDPRRLLDGHDRGRSTRSHHPARARVLFRRLPMEESGWQR